MRKLFMLATLLLIGASAHAEAPPALDVPALSKLLTRDQASTVRFHEQQFRKVLSAPLERSGELVFQPPDVFIRRVQKPGNEEYKLEGDTLTIQMGTRKARHLSTRDQPLLRGLMLSFQAVVSGKLTTLEPYYLLQLTGDAAQWQLVLDPKDTTLKQPVKRVVIDGRESNPLRFEVLEQSGDRTVTEIEP
jgi:outer membrane lipoprotein-sorting protein